MKFLSLFAVLLAFPLVAQPPLEEVEWMYMTPSKFREKVNEAPVAYLPLGTLEWHGEHGPLGADGLQPMGLFRELAARAGGVVLPSLFLGPDNAKTVDGDFYVGMDMLDRNYKATIEPSQLDGSAYYAESGLFNLMIERIVANIARQGIRVLVAVGHGPSITAVREMADEMWKKHRVQLITLHYNYPGEDPAENAKYCFQCDHAGKNETSITMYYYPETVHLEYLSDDLSEYPRGVGGEDPRLSSSEFGKKIAEYQLERMEKLLKKVLEEMEP